MSLYTKTDTTVGTPGGYVGGTNGSDTYNLTSTNGLDQFHPYAKGGNDTFNMYFSDITSYSHGHHVYSQDDYIDGQGIKHHSTAPVIADNYNFLDVDEVKTGGAIVGRLDDFDDSRDHINIMGEALILDDLASFQHANVKSVEIVAYAGNHNDPGAQTQQWLLIQTMDDAGNDGGYIFYALEGARQDVDDTEPGGSQSGERHFVRFVDDNDGTPWDDHNGFDFDTFFSGLPRVSYEDPQNVVPLDEINNAQGGVTYNDLDRSKADVEDFIGDELDEATAFGDLIAGGLNDDTIYGQGGNDQIWGGTGHDTVFGGDGNDTAWGGFGDDMLNGGAGTDTLYGGTGDDTLYGKAGDDTLRGEDGSDLIYGGTGNDWLVAGNGDDTLYGAIGNDNLRGDAGDDALYGQDGDDDLRGGDGDDDLYGGSGDDVLRGGSDRDQLIGGDGADTLFGNNGRDILRGDAGDDTMTGGNGNDDFIFNSGFGHDTITDFNASGNDRLVFSDMGSGFSIDDLTFVNVGSDTMIKLNGNITDSILLEGFAGGQQADYLIFA